MDANVLERQRAYLVKMRSRLISNVQQVEQTIVDGVRAPGDLSNAPTHLATEDERGVDENITLAQNQQRLLEQVETALDRIERGFYGRCEDCGREITGERLEALPLTRHCIEFASRHQEGGKAAISP